jgi:hypothetical protein
VIYNTLADLVDLFSKVNLFLKVLLNELFYSHSPIVVLIEVFKNSLGQVHIEVAFRVLLAKGLKKLLRLNETIAISIELFEFSHELLFILIELSLLFNLTFAVDVCVPIPELLVGISISGDAACCRSSSSAASSVLASGDASIRRGGRRNQIVYVHT